MKKMDIYLWNKKIIKKNNKLEEIEKQDIFARNSRAKIPD